MTSISRRLTVALLFFFSSFGIAQDFKSARIISPTQLPTGAGILATGDLNGDGIADVVYTVPNSPPGNFYSSFAIAFGSKNGFQSGNTYGQLLRWATLADVNGDGKLDIVGTQSISATSKLLIYKNNGDGTFAAPLITDVVTNTSAWPFLDHLAIGDFDGDKKLDVVAGLSDGTMEFLHGNGDGTFVGSAPFRPVAMLADPLTAFAADLNRDGKLDLIMRDPWGARVGVALGNGNGTFQPMSLLPGTYNYNPMVSDFDGDGVPDIVTTSIIYDPTTSLNVPYALIYLGNGDGIFRLANSFSYSPTFGAPLYIGDLDGDNKADIIFDDANGFTVAFGTGSGQFKAPVTYTAARWGGGGSAVGDFDGDGTLDILAAVNYNNSLVMMLKGLGGGVFEGADTIDVTSFPFAMTTGDLNGDGFPDFVVSTGIASSYTSNTFLANADGSFRSIKETQTIADKVFLKDLDGDNVPDELSVPSVPYSNVFFRHGNGDGTFGNSVAGISIYDGAYGVSLGDLNGDGIPELVEGASYLRVWQGTGNGTFSTANDYFAPPGSYYGANTLIGDVNNDGIQDVMVGGSQGVTVFLGTGDGMGTLAPSATTYPGSWFDWQDMDGDGKKDLITLSADAANPGFDIYLGDNSGSFGAGTHFPTTRAYSSFKVEDMNLDGARDLAFISGNLVAVMYADGHGGFGPEQTLVASDIAHDLAVGDWNHDGAPDLAVMNSTGASPSAQSIALFLNRGGDRVSLAASKDPTQYGEPLTATASVDATVVGSTVPAGNVLIAIDGGSPQSSALANAKLVLPLTLGVGSHVISGTYAGDGKFLPKTFADLHLTVTKASPTVTLTSSSNPVLFGSSTQLDVMVQPPFSGTPTGSVDIFDGSTLVTTLNIDANAHGTFSLSGLSQSHHLLSAQYSGDGNFTPSTSGTLDENVVYPAAITLSSDVASSLVGTTITFTVNVSSQYGVPSGNMVLYDGSQMLGQTALISGSGSLAVSGLAPGVHHMTARYPGDSTYAPAASTAVDVTYTDFAISAATSTATVSRGASATFALTVNPTSGFNGTVVFACTGAPALATCTVNPSSVAVNGAPASATVTVTTTGPNHAMLRRRENGNVLAKLGGVLSTTVFGFVLIGSVGRKRQRVLAVLTIAVLIGGMMACGGGGGSTPAPQPSPATPTGNSSIVVTATTTSGNITAQHSVTLNLTVN